MSWPWPSDEQQRRIAQLADRAGDLQALPAVVTRALQCIDDPGSSTAQLAAILNTDQIMASRLIGLANSGLYSGVSRFVTVREAVVRLGYRTVRDLLLATVLSGLARVPSRLYGLGPGRLWLHSLATGIAARLIAEDTRVPDPERAYVAGLLHDLGRAVLDRALSTSEIAAVRRLVKERGIPYQVAEAEVLGFTHSDVGAHRLSRLGVGPELVEAVAMHHRPRPGTLSAVVHAADVLAIKAVDPAEVDPGWGYSIEPKDLLGLGPTVAAMMDEPAQLERFLEGVRAGIKEAEALL